MAQALMSQALMICQYISNWSCCYYSSSYVFWVAKFTINSLAAAAAVVVAVSVVVAVAAEVGVAVAGDKYNFTHDP